MNSKNENEEINIIWQPQKGSQEIYLACPIYEVLYDGTRGSQKTDSIIMDFAQHIGKGYGRSWRGLIFRRTYKQLDDFIERTKKWFYQIFPGAKYNESKYVWTFPGKEQLLLRHMDNPDDYWNYHGHEYSIYHKGYIKYANGKQIQARDVKVGDLIQTLQGPKKVTKTFHYEKPAIKLSVYDSYSNLIGEQLQGVLHPVLTTYGWQRIGLSCLSQTLKQSLPVKPLLKEVYKFLSGVHREIYYSFFRILDNPLDDSISQLHRIQFSSLHQILSQLHEAVGLYHEAPKLSSYIDLNNQKASFLGEDLENAASTYGHEYQDIRQLALVCQSLAFLVLHVHSIHVRLIQSIACYYSDKYSLLSRQIPQSFQQYQHGKLHNFSQPPLPFRLTLDQIAWNDTFAYVQILKQGMLNFQNNCQNEYGLNGGIPLQVLGTSQPFFPIKNDVQTSNRPTNNKDAQDNSSGHTPYEDIQNVYTHPYTHESFETNIPLKSYHFSVQSSETPFVKMVDFEIEDVNHYITQLESVTQDKNDNSSIFLVNSNSFIGWEELTGWPDDKCYEAMKSCCRSSNPDVPRKYRSTTNSWGIGMNWVKRYFVDPAPPGTIISNNIGEQRVRIHGSILENKVLLKADPEYIKKLDSIKDPNKRKAWRDGSWDITAGGAFDDIWDEVRHVVEPFEIPHSWYVDRSFDWGSARPFSVGWWAESDGTEITLADGKIKSFPRGTIFRIYEFYGWNGTENEGCRMVASEIAQEIKRIEVSIEFEKIIGNRGVVRGPADSSIYDEENNMCIAADMRREGVNWTRANKKPGSRKQGLEKLRRFLKNSQEIPMEKPGLLIFSNCRHFIRTVPVLPRDKRNIEDVATEAEDHAYDETRYRLMSKRYKTREQKKYR